MCRVQPLPCIYCRHKQWLRTSPSLIFQESMFSTMSWGTKWYFQFSSFRPLFVEGQFFHWLYSIKKKTALEIVYMLFTLKVQSYQIMIDYILRWSVIKSQVLLKKKKGPATAAEGYLAMQWDCWDWNFTHKSRQAPVQSVQSWSSISDQCCFSWDDSWKQLLQVSSKHHQASSCCYLPQPIVKRVIWESLTNYIPSFFFSQHYFPARRN